jgi:hypothetical protein
MSLRATTFGVVIVCAVVSAAGAQEVIFSRTYVRATGAPVTVTDNFSACDVAGQFHLVVENGPGGTGRISSATIAVNGLEIVHQSDFNQQVALIERPIPNVAANNTLAVYLASPPGGTIRASVRAVQSCGIRITSPTAGSILTGPQVLVQGTIPASFGPDVAVTVNRTRALTASGHFAALVRVDPLVTALTAVAKNSSGATLDDDTIAVTVQGSADPAIHLGASPATGVAPLAVELTLMSTVAVGQITVDQDGDGVIDFQGTSLDGLRFTYTKPGVYLATATVTGAGGTEHGSAIIQVYDRAELEQLLQAKWLAMKDRLRTDDVAGAVQFIATHARDRYRTALEAIAADLPEIDSILTPLTFVDVWGPEARFQMQRSDGGVVKNFEVRFGVDNDGVWRLTAF